MEKVVDEKFVESEIEDALMHSNVAYNALALLDTNEDEVSVLMVVPEGSTDVDIGEHIRFLQNSLEKIRKHIGGAIEADIFLRGELGNMMVDALIGLAEGGDE